MKEIFIVILLIKGSIKKIELFSEKKKARIYAFNIFKKNKRHMKLFPIYMEECDELPEILDKSTTWDVSGGSSGNNWFASMKITPGKIYSFQSVHTMDEYDGCWTESSSVTVVITKRSY